MTVNIANRHKAMLLTAVVLGLVFSAASLTLMSAASAVKDAAMIEGDEQDFDQISLGRVPCCVMLPDDWIYWDR